MAKQPNARYFPDFLKQVPPDLRYTHNRAQTLLARREIESAIKSDFTADVFGESAGDKR